MAREADRHLGDFKPRELANTAWAFAMLDQADEQLFMVLAREAEQCLGVLNPQDLVNTAWGFAKASNSDACKFHRTEW